MRFNAFLKHLGEHDFESADILVPCSLSIYSLGQLSERQEKVISHEHLAVAVLGMTGFYWSSLGSFYKSCVEDVQTELV